MRDFDMIYVGLRAGDEETRILDDIDQREAEIAAMESVAPKYSGMALE